MGLYPEKLNLNKVIINSICLDIIVFLYAAYGQQFLIKIDDQIIKTEKNVQVSSLCLNNSAVYCILLNLTCHEFLPIHSHVDNVYNL